MGQRASRPLALGMAQAHIRGMTRTLFCFGYGYSAQALGARLRREGGWRIIGTTRDAAKADALRAQGIEPVIWPGPDGPDDPDIAALLDQATHLLISAGPGDGGDPVLAALRGDIERIAPQLDWAGYLSTTGVYGDHGGAWVDETAPLTPGTRRGVLRQQAEAAWGAIPDLPLHIFRLAGIYGPGRGPFAKVRSGKARRIIKEGQVFSRIHVEDIAQIVAASMHAPDPGAVYNVCDDDPAPPQDVIAHAAQLLGLPLPEAVPFEQAEMSPMARSFYAESKRVRNDRIKTDLGISLLYPSYRDGLPAIMDGD